MALNALQTRYLNAKRALFDQYYQRQNARQREAIFTINDPLLILAGAGSGKTTVLVRRIAYMIRYGNAYYSDTVPDDLTESAVCALEAAVSLPPEEIAAYLDFFISSPCPPWAVLAITFTNKAANEIKTRLVTELGDESVASEIWAGTFHSICMRILRRYGDRVGYAPGFSVCDMDDAKKLISRCMQELQIDERVLQPKTALNAISRAKDSLTTPEEYEEQAGNDFKLRQIAKIYTLYQARLTESNILDFDDIIMKTVQLLEENDDVRTYYAGRFRYVSVDEYQDTNGAQLKLTLLLSSVHNNLMVVGDDDQSIYKFRGATIENILNFDKRCRGTKVIKLEQNYRSTKCILDAANHIIANNVGRRGKALWTAGEEGEPITVRRLDNQSGEAHFIVHTIEDLVSSRFCAYHDIAVLYRVNAQSGSLEGAFAKSGLPYRMLGGTRFYDRKEIRDIIAYLCVINNPSDNLRLRRIINEPKRKIGDAAVNAIAQIADEAHKSMMEVIRFSANYPVLKNYGPRLAAFADMIDQIRKKQEESTVSEVIRLTIDISGYRQMLINMGEDGVDRLENIEELISAAIEYENKDESPSLCGFLEDVALVSDIDKYDESADAVVLMTIHSAKGLEFPVVFLPGMEDGIFPGMQSIMHPSELEEERRLAYVAVTRAKRKIYVTHVRERLLYGRTQCNPISRFMGEIPASLLDVETPQYASSGGMRFDTGIEVRTSASDRSRMQTAGAGGSRQSASAIRRPEKPAVQFAVGDSVIHRTFGQGTILSVKPMGGDILYEIVFETVGTKKLMATYARLRRA